MDIDFWLVWPAMEEDSSPLERLTTTPDDVSWVGFQAAGPQELAWWLFWACHRTLWPTDPDMSEVAADGEPNVWQHGLWRGGDLSLDVRDVTDEGHEVFSWACRVFEAAMHDSEALAAEIDRLKYDIWRHAEQASRRVRHRA
jgi:hypothetical protein